MTRLIFIIGLVLSASVASAQTHPCDIASPGSARVASTTPLKAEFCVKQAQNVDAVTVYDGTVATNLTTLEIVTPTPNATGDVLVRVALGTFAAGIHNVQVSAWNKSNVDDAPQESGKSSPFVLTVVVPNSPPTAPVVKRVGS